MNDESETDVLLKAGMVVEVDANRMAQIIFDTCPTSKACAAKAANLIIDYLIEVHSTPSKPQ